MLRMLSFTLVLLTCTASNTAAAQAPDMRELYIAAYQAIPEEQHPGVEQRQSFATAIEALWVGFDMSVPRLSPSEHQWIESETVNILDARWMRAIKSKEYAILRLNEHTDLCLATIRKVLDSYSSEQARDTEMFYWLKMVNCYDGSDNVAAYLDQAELLQPDKPRGPSFLSPPGPASSTFQNVIVNKMAQAAMAETMGWTLSED